MFGKKRKEEPKIVFQPESQTAVLKCSICNGEQVAGFKDKDTGKFYEVMVIRSEEDLETFQQTYHITQITKEY